MDDDQCYKSTGRDLFYTEEMQCCQVIPAEMWPDNINRIHLS